MTNGQTKYRYLIYEQKNIITTIIGIYIYDYLYFSILSTLSYK